MSELYHNKYRVESARLRGWDYSQTGSYFVTICVKDKNRIFGNIINDEIVLSPIGNIARHEWLKTAELRKNVKLDEFIIMPNHFHGIIFIYPIVVVETQRADTVETQRAASLQPLHFNKPSPKPNSLSAIIRSYKSAVAKSIHEKYPDIPFQWQSRFHDHIVRDDSELTRIRSYIAYNPSNWEQDEINLKIGGENQCFG